jgi:hypothetical protein
LLDRETTIQQKIAALRAGIKIDSDIIYLHRYSQYKNHQAIAVKRHGTFLRAASPARGKRKILRELCASSGAGGENTKYPVS